MLKLKSIATFLTALTITGSLYAQGTINFNTQLVGARVYCGPVDPTNGPTGAVVGNAYGAQLYAAVGSITDESLLRAIGGRVNFRTGLNAGYVVVSTSSKNKWGESINPAVQIPGTIDADGSRQATVQMRAWDAAFETFESATVGGGATGKSNLILVNAGFPPSTPPNLVGLKSFGVVCVPEPSAFALGALGVGLFLASRRNPKRPS